MSFNFTTSTRTYSSSPYYQQQYIPQQYGQPPPQPQYQPQQYQPQQYQPQQYQPQQYQPQQYQPQQYQQPIYPDQQQVPQQQSTQTTAETGTQQNNNSNDLKTEDIVTKSEENPYNKDDKNVNTNYGTVNEKGEITYKDDEVKKNNKTHNKQNNNQRKASQNNKSEHNTQNNPQYYVTTHTHDIEIINGKVTKNNSVTIINGLNTSEKNKNYLRKQSIKDQNFLLSHDKIGIHKVLKIWKTFCIIFLTIVIIISIASGLISWLTYMIKKTIDKALISSLEGANSVQDYLTNLLAKVFVKWDDERKNWLIYVINNSEELSKKFNKNNNK